jgi:predicted transcriptional regulator
MKRRDRLQVIHDILTVIKEKNEKIRPTHILYKSDLSHEMLNEYLNELISKNFIIEHKKKAGKTYSLTQKGYDYLSQYKFIINFIDSFGLR